MNHLTNEQNRIQQTAAFGLPLRQQSIDVSNMTLEQIEALRGVLFQHDARNAAMTREFDLNNPPKVPYRYQEYPRMLYRGDKTVIVKDDGECAAFLANGWSKDPAAAIEVNIAPELDSQSVAEIAAINARLRVSLREKIYCAR
jgi:hypothetical protein